MNESDNDVERALADRIALRALVDVYARHVDRRDALAAASLFTADGRLVTFLHGDPGAPPIVRRGRDEIAGALAADLDRYIVTTHVVGGQLVDVDGDGAAGDALCLVHHIYERHGARRMAVMAVRYADMFTRQAEEWRFAERQLHVDWREDRAMTGE